MKTKKIIFTLAAISFLISGCAQKTSQTVGSYKIKDLTEKQFNQEFIVGKTTLSQAKEKLGKPVNKLKSQGFDFYSWSYGTVEGESNGLESVPYVNILFAKAGGKSKQKIVTLGFDNNNILAHKKWSGTKEINIDFKGLLTK